MKKRKFIKLTKIEKALVSLAEHMERCPYNEYKVQQEILDILEIEKVPSKNKV